MSAEEENITLTVRLIRSFPHRNVKHLILHNVNLSQTTKQFMDSVLADLPSKQGIPPPFKTFKYDTMKIEHTAHGAKTSNPVMNTEDDEKLILKVDTLLRESGVRHETEISFFKMADYKEYKDNPEIKW